ncbi:hypothetical protein DUI87_14745 [Hirundo rustica rustica]|uniref:Helicase ATP-binding domain-containing protein n=1 Tax=Hirundo rustica rustica TaxID=333673 RepID=A0A3M0KBQ9_HIRRU|nr:hypothetical protein DUI87_14745 [Hirundo rustica rustica]
MMGRLRDFTFGLKMFNSTDMVFSLDSLFYEKPDMRQRVNNEEIVSENGIKIQSFSNASEILDMTVAPIKALCSQRFDDWKEKFGPIGLTCKELTGDTLMDDLFEIHHADIIITTPEKWDSMTRRWRDNSIVQLVRLFLIDEFCATRKGVQQAASVLAKDAKFLLSIEQKQRLQGFANSLKDSKLRDLLTYGVAYHHAGMEISDRKIIEGAFTVGDLPVLCFSSGLDKVGIEAKLQETGRLMAWYYIAFDTVKQFFTIKGTETLNELISMISNCTEFVDVKLRINEKKILNTLNKDKDKVTIRDSVLLKTGNWMKKIEVKRALKSEDISINLISSDYVGLDINQTYTVFYLTRKTEGCKVVTNQKLKAESTLGVCYGSPQSLPAAEVDTGGRSKQEIAYKKYGNRECNHRCKNKDVCGHDCCKTGVPPKSQMTGDTEFSLYLADLRSRNSVSSIPPVKRLKVQMLNRAENVDLKQFVFTPKSLLPALPRSSNKLSSSSPSVDQIDNINTLEMSQKQLQSWNCGKSNKSRSCFSDALNVDFELRDDIWDDIDDEKLVFASNFVSRELEHGNTCLQIPDECQPVCQYTASKPTDNRSKEYLLDDESNDVKPFLGIFDDIL